MAITDVPKAHDRSVNDKEFKKKRILLIGVSNDEFNKVRDTLREIGHDVFPYNDKDFSFERLEEITAHYDVVYHVTDKQEVELPIKTQENDEEEQEKDADADSDSSGDSKLNEENGGGTEGNQIKEPTDSDSATPGNQTSTDAVSTTDEPTKPTLDSDMHNDNELNKSE